MTIKNLTNEIFEKSFSRESLEKLLTKEIKKKMNDLAERFCAEEPGYYDELIKKILKSD